MPLPKRQTDTPIGGSFVTDMTPDASGVWVPCSAPPPDTNEDGGDGNAPGRAGAAIANGDQPATDSTKAGDRSGEASPTPTAGGRDRRGEPSVTSSPAPQDDHDRVHALFASHSRLQRLQTTSGLLDFYAKMIAANPRFSPAALAAAFCLIRRHIDKSGQSAAPRGRASAARLGRETRRDKATIIRALRELRERGAWLVEAGPPGRGGRSNSYSPNPEWVGWLKAEQQGGR